MNKCSAVQYFIDYKYYFEIFHYYIIDKEFCLSRHSLRRIAIYFLLCFKETQATKETFLKLVWFKMCIDTLHIR